jgi:hypothetical protein
MLAINPAGTVYDENCPKQNRPMREAQPNRAAERRQNLATPAGRGFDFSW